MSEQTNVIEGHFDEAEFFADPKKITRIPVPAIKGWIDVREEITVKEERQVFSKAFKGQITTKAGETRNEYDMEQISFGNVVMYVCGWSLRKPCTADSLKALKPQIYKAIDDAVQKHLDAVKEGKAQSESGPVAAPISPSAA